MLLMEQVLTIVGKLKPSIEIAQEIEATLFAFADACNGSLNIAAIGASVSRLGGSGYLLLFSQQR